VAESAHATPIIRKNLFTFIADDPVGGESAGLARKQSGSQDVIKTQLNAPLKARAGGLSFAEDG